MKARKNQYRKISRAIERPHGHCSVQPQLYPSCQEIADSIILMVVLLNAILGVVQEGKAEKPLRCRNGLTLLESRTDGKLFKLNRKKSYPVILFF